MNDQVPHDDLPTIDLDTVREAFEYAWYEEPSRCLDADNLCEMFPTPVERHLLIRAAYPEWRRSLRKSDLRVLIENAVREGCPIKWKELLGSDPELEPWARAHFKKCGGKEVDTLLAEASAVLNLRGSSGERDFELKGIAGSGGFGIVYEAYDAILDRRVAVKRVLPKWKDTAGALNRLEREALILAKLEHPNILPMYDFLPPSPAGGAGQEPAFVMRLLPETLVRQSEITCKTGAPKLVIRTLKEAIADFHSSELPWDADSQRRSQFRQLLQKFVEVCHGVAYAHQRKVIHRDIKPSNVVVGPHGETVIIDWGIARILVEDQMTSDDLSRPRTRVEDLGYEFPLDESGTESYASPEQWRQHPQLQGVDPVRHPTDVFALGAMLWEILNGKTPAKELRHTARFEHFCDWAPPALKAIVLQATAFDPWNRFIGSRELKWYQERGLGLEVRSPNQHAGNHGNSRGDPNEPVAGGVEQFGRAVQDWLDAEAHQRISKPLEDRIAVTTQALTQTAESLQERQRELEAASASLLATNESLAKTESEIGHLRVTKQALGKARTVLMAVAAVLLLAVGALFTWSSQLGQSVSTLTSNQAQLQEQARDANKRLVDTLASLAAAEQAKDDAAKRTSVLEIEASIARADRNSDSLRTTLSLVNDRHFGEAASTLSKVSDPPDSFIWNYALFAAGAEPLRTLTSAEGGISIHTGAVLAVAASPDGTRFFTFGKDGRLLTWDAQRETPIKESTVGPRVGKVGLGLNVIDGGLTVTSLPQGLPAAESRSFQLGDRILAVGSSETDMQSVDGENLQQVVGRISGPPDTKVVVQFVRPGSEPQVAVITRRGFTAVSEWQLLQRFSPDGRWLAASGKIDEKTITVWLVDTATGAVRKDWTLADSPGNPYDLMSLSFSQDVTRLLIGGSFPQQGLLKLLGPTNKGIVVDLTNPEFPVIDEHAPTGYGPFGWILSADGSTATGIGLSTVSSPFGRWGIDKRDEERFSGLASMGALTTPTGFANCVSPDGKFLIMAGFELPIQVFTGDGSIWLTSLDATSSHRATAFSPNGALFATANGMEIEIYRTAGWAPVASHPIDMTYQPNGLQPSLAFTADGQQLLIGSESGLQSLAFDRPTATVDFGLTHIAAARWTSSGTVWIAQDGSSERHGIALREIAPDGTIVRTVVNGLGGQTAPAVMSADGSHVLLTKSVSEWGNHGLLERWRLEPEPHRMWSYSDVGNAVRPISLQADGTALAEFAASHFGVTVATNTSRIVRVVDPQGLSRGQIPAALQFADRVGVSGHTVMFTPDALESFRRGPISPARLSVSAAPGSAAIYELPLQVLASAVSDDGNFLAIFVINPDQRDGKEGTLKVLDANTGAELAAFKSRRLGSPADNAMNFSPDGKRIVIGTVRGEILVWDHTNDQTSLDIKWPAVGWGMTWVAGATFSPDGQRVIVSAFDFTDLVQVDRITRDISRQHGAMGVIDLTQPKPVVRVLPDVVGLILFGESSADRRRVASTNIVTGEVRVWDLTTGEPREVARLKDETAGEYDPRWADLASVRSIVVSPDQSRIAIAGPVGRPDSFKARIVVLSIEGRRTLHSIEIDKAIADDIAWNGDSLAVLTHDPFSETAPLTVRLRHWVPGEVAASEVAVYNANIGKQLYVDAAGAMVRPCFNFAGDKFAVPIQDATLAAQSVAVYATQSGKELARPTQLTRAEVVHAYQWTADDKIVLSTLAVLERERRIVTWNPAERVLSHFKIEDVPVSGEAMFTTGAFHVAVSSTDGTVAIQRFNQSLLEIWSAEQEKMIGRIHLPEPVTLRHMAFSPANDALLMIGQTRGAYILRGPKPEREVNKRGWRRRG